MNYEQFNNIHLENEILSIVIKDQCVLDELININSDIFYNSQNKCLWEVIKTLWTNNEAVNTATVYSLLRDNISKVGGLTRITDLETSYTTSQGYNVIVKTLEDYRKRRSLKALNDKITKLFVDEKETEEIVQAINHNIEKLIDNEDKSDGDMTTAIEELAVEIEDRIKNKGKIKGIETTLRCLDKRINGLNKQEMIIVAGRPAQGKTTLANNIALNILGQGKKVALFNLEMSKSQIIEKLLANVAMVEMDKIKFGLLDDRELSKIGRANDRLLSLMSNIKAYDDVLHIDKIISTAKKLKKQNKLDVVVVDYLQLVECDKKGNREQEVAHISRRLKLLSKELKINVIVLSQLSRGPEQRQDHRPILSDLRESGAIEQDADIILFCYRDEYYNKETEEKNVMEVICGKNRNGQTGIDKIAWIPQYQKVSNLF